MVATEYVDQRVGGLGSHVAGLAPYLAETVALDLMVPRYDTKSPRQEALGRYGTLYRVDAHRPQDGDNYDVQVWQMNDELKNFVVESIEAGKRYDLLHAHDWLSGYTANFLRKEYEIPLVVTIHATEMGRVGDQRVHSHELSRRIHEAEKHLAERADIIIACSEFMRDEITVTLLQPDTATVVVPNGVNVDNFADLHRQRAKYMDYRAQWGGADDPLIFFVGRLVGEKGPDILIKAMPKILDSYPGAKLLLAGKGPFRKELEQLIRDFDVQDHVNLLGFVTDEEKNRLFAVSDLAIFPSRYEPFGIVALEAMAAGTPVIVTDVGGLREVVTHGVTGLCVPPERPDAVAAATIETLQDTDSADVRTQQAEREVRLQYGWDHVAALTEKVYEKVLLQPELMGQ